jgi:hypothetical protein
MSLVDRSNATRSVAMGHLRAFVTLLVIAHHAVLAYHPYAPPPAPDGSAWRELAWTAFPVFDAAKWSAAPLLVGYDDTFFMALMFFLSGLFTWPSLRHKGASRFALDRARRLGVPFVLSAALLAPLAYYPSYVQAGGGGGFWHAWASLPAWPAGPAWFLWVLLALDLVAAALTRRGPSWGDALGRAAQRAQRPWTFFLAMLAVGALTYPPMAAVVDPLRWVWFGPFFVQASRVLHYAAWFFAGVGVGAFGSDRGLLDKSGPLARRWGVWIAVSATSFVLELVAVIAIFSMFEKGAAPGRGLRVFADAMFVVTCAASCLASLALALRFARPSRVADSLDANAYGMYLAHYPIVSWLQLALLAAPLAGAVKAALVFAGAAAASWATASLARKTPRFARRGAAVVTALVASSTGCFLYHVEYAELPSAAASDEWTTRSASCAADAGSDLDHAATASSSRRAGGS